MALPTGRMPLTDSDCISLLLAGEPGMLKKIKYVVINQTTNTAHIFDDVLSLHRAGYPKDDDKIYELGQQVNVKVSVSAIPVNTTRSVDKDKFYDI